MRKILAILAFITGILTFASCEDERQIKDTKLPSDARSFISLYFPDLEIIYAEKRILMIADAVIALSYQMEQK